MMGDGCNKNSINKEFHHRDTEYFGKPILVIDTCISSGIISVRTTGRLAQW